MSLATRCTACGTIFRVVQDQLRVSEGWVRCGRCAEVFDAREQLFDIDRDVPPQWHGASDAPAPAVISQPQPPTPALAARDEPPSGDQPEETRQHFAEPEPERFAEPEPAAPDYEPAGIDLPIDLPVDDSRPEPRWIDEEEPLAAATTTEHATAAKPAAPVRSENGEFEMMGAGPDVVLAPGLGASAPPADMPLPEFMRRAQNGERWRKPGVRLALGLGAVLLLALLGVQTTHHFRDAILALQPQSRPMLQALCELSGCELRPWRRIHGLSVLTSALSQAGVGNQYQLTVNLYNETGVELATPWIELNLTDAAGVVVTRRMLAPEDFKSAKSTISAGAEMPLQVLLATDSQPVSGYSIEIFHP
jgi:predicted Zn finger-like uncharacterized protein